MAYTKAKIESVILVGMELAKIVPGKCFFNTEFHTRRNINTSTPAFRQGGSVSPSKGLPKFGLIAQCSGRVSSPRVGFVGKDRFEEGSLPGSYGKTIPESELGEEVLLTFNKGSRKVKVSARSGENLLQVAERCGVMIPDMDFCFQGSCSDCEMEVVGGAQEVGGQGSSDIIRSCLCPVPKGRTSIDVNIFDDTL